MENRPIAYEGDLPYIFISYAHKDAEAVIPAIAALQEAGYPVWYDAGIQAGTEWPEYIASHLLNSSLVIAFISAASIASNNCRQEIVFALDKRKPMLTVRLDEAELPVGMQMQLNLCQALMAYRHANREGYIEELVKAPFIAETIHIQPKETVSGETEAVTEAPTAPAAEGTEVHSKDLQHIMQKGSEWFADFVDTKDTSSQYAKSDIEGNKAMGILCYLSLLVLIPIFAAKESKFVRFHANQGLILAVIGTGGSLAIKLLSLMTMGLLKFLFNIIVFAFFVATVVFSVVGIINVVNGRAKELPLIGKFRWLK